MSITALNEKLEFIRNLIANEQDEDAKTMLRNDEAGVLAQIVEANKEAIIADVRDPESSFTLTVNGYTVDFRTEAASEESYQALSIVTQLKLQEVEESNQAEINAIRESYKADIDHNDKVIRQLKDTNHQLEGERSDFENKWKAATTQVNELSIDNQSLAEQNRLLVEEAATLKKTIEDLRNQVNKPSVPTNTDIGALEEAIKAAQAAKPAIYNVVKDQFGVNFTANLLETDEEVTGKVMYIGKYRVATDDEVKRFREEREEARNAVVESAPTEEPVQVEAPELQFQGEAEPTVPEHVLHGEVAPTAEGTVPSIEERVAALEAAVFGTVNNTLAVLAQRTGGLITEDELKTEAA